MIGVDLVVILPSGTDVFAGNLSPGSAEPSMGGVKPIFNHFLSKFHPELGNYVLKLRLLRKYHNRIYFWSS